VLWPASGECSPRRSRHRLQDTEQPLKCRPPARRDGDAEPGGIPIAKIVGLPNPKPPGPAASAGRPPQRANRTATATAPA
jgi:hypothetical protein